MNNVVKMSDYKARFDKMTVYIGDLIEWKDYTGELYKGVVKDLKLNPIVPTGKGMIVTYMLLANKDGYSVTLDTGMILSGSIVTRKIVRKMENPFSLKKVGK